VVIVIAVLPYSGPTILCPVKISGKEYRIKNIPI
jgi:hypothetical protein